MINFTSQGNVELLGPLVDKLRDFGAITGVVNPDLILVGATSVDEAMTHLTNISSEDRGKVIVVGLDEDLEYHPRPKPGSFGEFLETSRILGTMPLRMTTNWDAFGFIGPKAIADKMPELWYGGPAHSPSYAIWAGLSDFPNVAAFLDRLVDFIRSERLT